jgi:hypothetical protein
VLFVGRAQEKAGVWRTQRRYSPSTGVLSVASDEEGGGRWRR